jgi:bifunctional non-homologous end joining protein LigD
VIPRIAPMLASPKPLADEEGFAHEIKWDGYRAVAYIEDGRAELVSRGGYSLSGCVPELMGFLSGLPHQPLALDGELIALGKGGLPSFFELRKGSHGQGTLAYAAFDLLYYGGDSLCPLPWHQRRACLEELLPEGGPAFVSPLFPGPLPQLLRKVEALGLEGVVSKQVDAPYLPGVRSEAWRKARVFHRDDFVVGGLKVGQRGVRALLVGQYSPVRRILFYQGGVAAGLSQSELQFLQVAKDELALSCSPFQNAPKLGEAVWLSPTLVAEVQYSEFTPDGRLRHPVFIRFRFDKRPQECVFEGGDSSDHRGS